jgi:hypothetical protein
LFDQKKQKRSLLAAETIMLSRVAAGSLQVLLGQGAPTGCLAAASRLYHKNVVDHYERPRNVGSFDKNDPNGGCTMQSTVAGAAAAAAAAAALCNADIHAVVCFQAVNPSTPHIVFPALLSFVSFHL